MDTQNQGTSNSRHKTVELGCAALYMSPNFAHSIGRITGYLRFVPKFIGRDLIFPVTESSQQLMYLKKLHKEAQIFHLGNSYCSSLLINELIILEINPNTPIEKGAMDGIVPIV